MANINVRKRLEKVSNDLQKIATHIAQHSGVDPKDAPYIDNTSTGIAELAAKISAEAREKMGQRNSHSLVKGVRKALGYTYP